MNFEASIMSKLKSELKEIPKEQRQNLLIKYLTIVFGFIGSFVLIASVVLLTFFVPSYIPGSENNTGIGGIFSAGDPIRIPGGIGSFIQGWENVPISTNFVVYGIDEEGGGSDVIMIGTFNRNTGAINLISIPRDTFVVERPATMDVLGELDRRFPHISPKITDLFRVGGRTHGPRIVGTYLEEWLGIQFDYYAVVDLAAFRRIVDAVGPILMYIPIDVFYDPGFYQEVFDIPAGWNYLDGRKAEWVVRFRRWDPTADMGRISMQQDFLQVLFQHMLQMDVLLNTETLIEMATIMMEYVDTNFGFISLASYAPHALNVTSLNAETMPGNPDMWINNISFVEPFHDEIIEMIDRVFHGIFELEDDDEDSITIVATN